MRLLHEGVSCVRFLRTGALLLFCACAMLPRAAAQSCGAHHGVAVQVLAPADRNCRTSAPPAHYLVWERLVALACWGTREGEAPRFGESGAQMSQLGVIFSHFHVDHSGDFAALIKSSWFEDRKERPLPILWTGRQQHSCQPPPIRGGLLRGQARRVSLFKRAAGSGRGKQLQTTAHDVEAAKKPVAAFPQWRTFRLRGSRRFMEEFRPWRGAWNWAANASYDGDTNGEADSPDWQRTVADRPQCRPGSATGVERRLHMHRRPLSGRSPATRMSNTWSCLTACCAL